MLLRYTRKEILDTMPKDTSEPESVQIKLNTILALLKELLARSDSELNGIR